MMKIKTAVVKLCDGSVRALPKPARHHDIVHMLEDEGHHQHPGDVQGFLTEDGTFVDRAEGAKIALMSG